MFEPGRVIAGNAGVLLTRVIRSKRSGNGPPFVVVDAAMNDLARPAMYGAWHDFDAVAPTGDRMTAHIVGPICETGDVLGRNRLLPETRAGDLVLIENCGAYGAVMSSRYNLREPASESCLEAQ